MPFQYWPEWIEKEMNRKLLDFMYNKEPLMKTQRVMSESKSFRSMSPKRSNRMAQSQRLDNIDKKMQIKAHRTTIIADFCMKEDYFKPPLDPIVEEDRT